MNAKIIVHARKGYNWNPSKCICENSKYLKSVADTSVITCDKIIFVMTNTIARNVSINSDGKK